MDALIAALIGAQDRAEVVAAVRALDRVLISGSYAVPLFHLPEHWIARWTTIAHPATTSAVPAAGSPPATSMTASTILR